MVIMMLDFCNSNMYDSTITRYEWDSEGARDGTW